MNAKFEAQAFADREAVGPEAKLRRRALFTDNGPDRLQQQQGRQHAMSSLSTSSATSTPETAALPNAWLSLLGVAPSLPEPEGAGAAQDRTSVDLSTLSTAGYDAATFAVLYQALQAIQVAQAGPHLDALASALRCLFDRCDRNASILASIALEGGRHPLTEQLLWVEAQQARTIADAVHIVWAHARGCALGEVDRQDLNASWARVWAAVAAPSRPSHSG